MKPGYTLAQLLKLITEFLSQESVIYHTAGKIRLMKKFPLDDNVKCLHLSPLSMLYYNQRAIFLLLGGLFWAVIGARAGLMSFTNSDILNLGVLTGIWLFTIVATLSLHANFIKKLTRRPDAIRSNNALPVIFDRYYLMDYWSIFLLVVAGQVIPEVKTGHFIFLLPANIILYSTYCGAGRKFILLYTAIFAILLVMALSFLTPMRMSIAETSWFAKFLYLGPILVTFVLTMLWIRMIAWQRKKDQKITQLCFQLLVKYQTILKEQYFRNQVKKVFEDLCSLAPPFWYNAACLWFVEKHQDRGEILIPGPQVNFHEVYDYKDGLRTGVSLLNTAHFTLLHSIKYRSNQYHSQDPVFRTNLNVPAAFIPLHRGEKVIGVITLYGLQGGPPLQLQDEDFLKSLGSIISSALEQSQFLYKSPSQMAMDDLLKCSSIHDVFPTAAGILRKYLSAAGCMMIYRSSPDAAEMKVIARPGFNSAVDHLTYTVKNGLAGACARTGRPIRVDDVPGHINEFDAIRIGELEKSLGEPIKSWMAIPIGPEDKNYGVIIVVNRKFRCTWFTDEDQALGEELALRLHVIVEKFLHIDEAETAKQKSIRSATKALQAEREAREIAEKRQEDLMTMTHQLLGALSSTIGAVTRMKQKFLPGNVRYSLDHIHDLIEDAITICYGTSTTFATTIGQKTAFGTSEIDAPGELKNLCQRLQKTNHRHDLSFSYLKVPDFPTLHLDRDVFTSVMYSLIHNAMKYSDLNSEIVLECSFEKTTGEAALKIKSVGEPILPEEKERIFEKFERGYNIKTTGRHHHGVGLGLWVARQLMREIGGDLTVELTTINPRLAVFIVHVPTHDNRPPKN